MFLFALFGEYFLYYLLESLNIKKMFNIYELGKTSSYPHSVLNLFIQTQHQEQKCAKTFGRNVCAFK